MSQFTQILLVSPMDDGKTWVLRRNFCYRPEDSAAELIDVPIGFMTDFASVPWFVQWFIPKWGKYGNAAVIHDWLYWSQIYSREASDHILFEAMNVMQVDAFRKYFIFTAVRWFGQLAWWQNQEDRASGFNNRVLPETEIKAGAKSLRQGKLKQAYRAYKRLH